ncbi:hypothetical protein CROQUDRAFT_98963 [Cronartium quercuum f. sp. fusiforme G11]|uniref:Uncharacterized protein n=1 Tax=Cronartium quercuum f. sp. fusiforme G11 TaxID=708437 RepID=A0A9P6N7H9_9BASI|nr:hypothetical protein CROQUDRAFT_98963 [Cronartium quercuum f. sp. fusiforme G11]
MTPSLFGCASGANKYLIWISHLDKVNANNGTPLSQRKDFAYLQTIGINPVRIPIGYWMLGPGFRVGTPLEHVPGAYVNAWPQVLYASSLPFLILTPSFGACANGPPGSQNGKPSSGTSDGQFFEGDSAYLIYSDALNGERTIIADCVATRHMSGDRFTIPVPISRSLP